MRYLLIDPKAQTVEAKNHPTTMDWRSIVAALGCQYMTSAGRLPNGDILWVDDEGLLKDGPLDTLLMRDVNLQVLAGRGVITGPESPEDFATGKGGEITDCASTPESVLPLILWTNQRIVEGIDMVESKPMPGVTVLSSVIRFA